MWTIDVVLHVVLIKPVCDAHHLIASCFVTFLSEKNAFWANVHHMTNMEVAVVAVESNANPGSLYFACEETKQDMIKIFLHSTSVD